MSKDIFQEQRWSSLQMWKSERTFRKGSSREKIEDWRCIPQHFPSTTISYIAFIHTEYRLNLFIEVDSEKSIKHRYERSATFVGSKGPVCILNIAGVQNDIKRTHCCQYFDVQALNWIRTRKALQSNHCTCHHHPYSLFKSNNYPFKLCRRIWAVWN